MIENMIINDRSGSINDLLKEANADGWRAIAFGRTEYISVLMERENSRIIRDGSDV